MIADLNDLTADFIDTSIEAREWAWSELRVRYNSPQCIVLRYKGDITGVVFYTVDGDEIINSLLLTKPPWGIAGTDIENGAELAAKNADTILTHLFDTVGAKRVSVETSSGNKRMQKMWKRHTGQSFTPSGAGYEGYLTREQYLNR
mgnify:FL=1